MSLKKVAKLLPNHQVLSKVIKLLNCPCSIPTTRIKTINRLRKFINLDRSSIPVKHMRGRLRATIDQNLSTLILLLGSMITKTWARVISMSVVQTIVETQTTQTGRALKILVDRREGGLLRSGKMQIKNSSR